MFGATPPPLADDPVFQQGCLASCSLIAAAGDGEKAPVGEGDVQLAARVGEDGLSDPLPGASPTPSAPPPAPLGQCRGLAEPQLADGDPRSGVGTV